MIRVTTVSTSDFGDDDYNPLDDPQYRQRSEDPRIWLEKFKAHAQELAKAGRRAQERLAANEVTLENKLLRLTMGAGGTVKDIRFLSGADAASATQLTAAFKDLQTKAGAQVTRNTLGVMHTLVPEDDPSMQAIRDSVPADVRAEMDAEDEERNR